ncbi:MAG: hypothetical protein JSS43_20555, partial [Proteobacteria bacterium]|nr:hypothetical protein [Pseudomonadota bacterium]
MSTNAPVYSATFIYNGGGFEGFSVPVSGVYHVDLYGAQGGAAYAGAGQRRDGGKGAAVGGDIFLQEGADLSFGVGQAGQPGTVFGAIGGFGGGGGGGGTFLFELPPNGDHYILLAVAGGGGGG